MKKNTFYTILLELVLIHFAKNYLVILKSQFSLPNPLQIWYLKS